MNTDNKRVTVEEEWRASAEELAEWAEKLVNRHDCFGSYWRNESCATPVVCSTTNKEPITRRWLEDHFSSELEGHPTFITGLHVASADKADPRCKWVVVDIDVHDANDDPAYTSRLGEEIEQLARDAGLKCLLMDSNGKGGRHLWVIFDEPVPMAVAYRLGKWLVRNVSGKKPETFPKRPNLTGKGYGNWVRLPGRHHKHEKHFHRVWDPVEAVWLEGRKAIRRILATYPESGGPVNSEFVKQVVGAYDPDLAPGGPRRVPARAITANSLKEIVDAAEHRQALQIVDALFHLESHPDECDEYETWLRVGMALHHAFGGSDLGLELFDQWSSELPKYQGSDETQSKWQSFNEVDQGVTIGTLFALARDLGWVSGSGFENPAGNE